jgi:hypothetical protein
MRLNQLHRCIGVLLFATLVMADSLQSDALSALGHSNRDWQF